MNSDQALAILSKGESPYEASLRSTFTFDDLVSGAYAVSHCMRIYLDAYPDAILTWTGVGVSDETMNIVLSPERLAREIARFVVYLFNSDNQLSTSAYQLLEWLWYTARRFPRLLPHFHAENVKFYDAPGCSFHEMILLPKYRWAEDIYSRIKQ